MTKNGASESNRKQLRRELGLGGAIFMGLGAILGTGVFVSIGVAAGIAGSAVIPAIALAALLALCNALSAAQLAAAHPVSGGTYEYGYEFLSPWLGFTAGWMFISAKSASAATAALGFAGYLLYRFHIDTGWRVPIAAFAVIALTAIVLTGMRRSNRANTLIVGVTLIALIGFVLAGLPATVGHGATTLFDFTVGGQPVGATDLLYATALMFVAFTGYGRIATLGEEVRAPRITIPRAIIATLAISALVYIAVAVVAIGTLGAGPLAAATTGNAAPLQRAAEAFVVPGVGWLIAIGAITAMLGVLLNLILGLSRVLLAMGRRRDMPGVLARLDRNDVTPYVAVGVVGLIVLALTLIGNVETTWSFSAFTVLIYYALTNAAALRLPVAARRYPRFVSWLGLGGCVGLSFWVETPVWIAGIMVLAIGWLWHGVAILTWQQDK
ncbi:APC family permease [Salinisphaera hydrothermalis]|uniref:Amino acid transporter n=1 Tax=Salinisphaera hydrothermalis (strain C41B8) TaxID=1304275 RepID=A0A084IH45_SALHC|nr:APC family permease [Salinisphaera hydrothermalis]KEZ76029.1 amino acid transporter [Salinisphaera hydrothermalis C41B8]